MDARYLFFVTRNCHPVFLEGSANCARHRPPTVSRTVVLKNVFIFRAQSVTTVRTSTPNTETRRRTNERTEKLQKKVTFPRFALEQSLARFRKLLVISTVFVDGTLNYVSIKFNERSSFSYFRRTRILIPSGIVCKLVISRIAIVFRGQRPVASRSSRLYRRD